MRLVLLFALLWSGPSLLFSEVQDAKQPPASSRNADPALGQAGTQIAQNKTDAALAELQAVVTSAPDDPVLRYDLGRAFAARADWEQARQQFVKAIELRPDYVLAWLALAQMQVGRGEFDAALKSSQQVLAIDRDNTTAQLIAAAALIGQKKFGDARQLLDEMLKANPSSPDAFSQLGVVNLAENKYQEAEDAFRRSYELDPANARGLMGMVATEQAQNHPDRALQLLQTESAKAPNRSDLVLALGNTAVRAGKFDLAVSYFERVAASTQKGSEAQGDIYLRIGEAYRRKGDLSNSIVALQKARAILPDSGLVLNTLALVLDAAGRWFEASQVYERVVKLDPNNGVALNNLAFLMSEHGFDLDDALTKAQRAKQLLPDLSEVSDTVGWIYLKKNLTDNAIDVFKELVSKVPNEAGFRYHLGMAYSQKGDKVKALEQLREALKHNPAQQDKEKIRDLIGSLESSAVGAQEPDQPPAGIPNAGSSQASDPPIPSPAEARDLRKAMEAAVLASIGKPAADFTLPDLDGNEVKLSSLRGKVVLLDFWATWCAPCRQEMPEFQRIHREFAGKDVVVLALDVDEPLGTVAEYIDKEKFGFPVLLANGDGVMDRYGVRAYPTTFAIDKSGLIADVRMGGGWDSALRLQAMIEKARAGAPLPAPVSAPPPAVSSARSPAPAAPSASAEDFYRDAVRQHNSKDYAGAIQSLDRALDLRPGWLLAVITRADDQYHVKRYDEAIAGFDLAIQLDPKQSINYQGRGTMYSNSGRHAQAIPDLTRAIELGSDSAAAHNSRGWAYLETGHLDEALADLDKALDLNPAYTTALFNRAHLFEQRKEYAKAIADFDSVLRVDPANTVAAGRKAADLRLLQDNAAAPLSPALVAPKLLRPADGAVLRHSPRDTTVVWGEVSGGAAYIVEWDYKDDQGWASERNGTPARIRATERTAAFRFLGVQPGRWRVWAVDASGADGPKSEWREFRYTQ